MAEMLLQSHLGELVILPALPDAWKSGSIKGLKARGGYTVDIDWQNGLLKKAIIISRFNRIPKIRIGASYIDPTKDKRIEIQLAK
jgi:alpha-L-fucosidase 2